MVNLLKLSVTAILFGAIFILGINLISDAPSYTAHSESVNISSYPATITLQKNNLISGSFVLSNSTTAVISTTGNYSIAYDTGILTTTNPSGLANFTVFTATYHTGAQSSTLNTIVIVIMAIIVAVLGLILLLREAGIQVKF